MLKTIRIGTRDSELALYQANLVKKLLEQHGQNAQLIPVKSTGDKVLNKPLYELGITGIFTKTLDIALLNNDIDIAVHSLKDVPTALPEGIVQAAVLKRGNAKDILVFKQNEEFLSSKKAVIATGSLRRRAQWLNRYPTHTIENLRGNVNLRLQKLENNKNWNAAIFAAAGLGRIGLRPENSINLSWMLPAPAQGAIMVSTLKENNDVLKICALLNHEETEICTSIEREFLRLLEGGCTAPIGALATINEDLINFEGVLLSPDGTKKIAVSRSEKLGHHQDIASYCANYIIEKGGKRLMDNLKRSEKKINLFATKKLTETQRALFNENIGIKSTDFIQTSSNRLPSRLLSKPIKHVIITSKNTVQALLENFTPNQLQFSNIYCVGRRTKKLVESQIGNVTHTEANAEKLANYIATNVAIKSITYFCSNMRLNIIPEILKEKNIPLTEVEAYQTKFTPCKINETVNGIIFCSPSAVKSFKQENIANNNTIAFCIGESTAKEAKKHFKQIKIAKIPTVESIIELVNEYYT